MNLFENLTLAKESKQLNKKKQLNEDVVIPVNIFNELKYKIPQGITLKDIAYIPSVATIYENDYNVTLDINAKFQHMRKGLNILRCNINFITNEVNINEESYYINHFKSMIEDEEVNINVSDWLNDVEIIKENIKKLLTPKFLQKWNGTKSNTSAYSSAYKTEALSDSTPSWLKTVINNKSANYNTAGNSLLPLDTIKWTEAPFPEKGKLNPNQIHAFLIDSSGDEGLGTYFAFIPYLNIGNNKTIYINGRDRKVENMSIVALQPYVKQYAYADKSEVDVVRNKRNDRRDAKSGMVQRFNNKTKPWAAILDKSGYIVDPTKYVRQLAELNKDEYAERLEDVYVLLSNARENLQLILSDESFIPDAKTTNTSNFHTFDKLFKVYKSAIVYYDMALNNIDKLGDVSVYGGDVLDRFNDYLQDAETKAVSIIQDTTELLK